MTVAEYWPHERRELARANTFIARGDPYRAGIILAELNRALDTAIATREAYARAGILQSTALVPDYSEAA